MPRPSPSNAVASYPLRSSPRIDPHLSIGSGRLVRVRALCQVHRAAAIPPYRPIGGVTAERVLHQRSPTASGVQTAPILAENRPPPVDWQREASTGAGPMPSAQSRSDSAL